MAQDHRIPVELLLFAKNIRFARQNAKLRQVDVTALSGIAQDFLSRLERAETGIGLETMARLSRVLQVPLCDLLQPDFVKSYSLALTSRRWANYKKLFHPEEPPFFELELFATNFKRARIEANLTIAEVEELSGYQVSDVSIAEKGEQSTQLITAVRIAAVVQVPLRLLLTPAKEI
jgi:transcriptional regulator with XRE-family HTH domain